MFPNLGPPEMIVVMVLAVLLFGKRLPEVGRSLGKGIIEFKKGLNGLGDGLDGPTTATPSRTTPSYRAAEPPRTSVPKFEPPSAPPVALSEAETQAYQD